MPSAYDPITARLVERLRFKAVYNGGVVTGGSSCISAPMLTMTEQIRVASDMANAVQIPVMMDAGAGWGEPPHTTRTVRECIGPESRASTSRTSSTRSARTTIVVRKN